MGWPTHFAGPLALAPDPLFVFVRTVVAMIASAIPAPSASHQSISARSFLPAAPASRPPAKQFCQPHSIAPAKPPSSLHPATPANQIQRVSLPTRPAHRPSLRKPREWLAPPPPTTSLLPH